MKVGEKGIAFFISTLGYGGDGSSGTVAIPSYSPLMFELELIKEK